MYRVQLSSRYKQGLKTASKRGYDLTQMEYVVNTLASGKKLAKKYKDHSLSGNYVASAIVISDQTGY